MLNGAESMPVKMARETKGQAQCCLFLGCLCNAQILLIAAIIAVKNKVDARPHISFYFTGARSVLSTMVMVKDTIAK